MIFLQVARNLGWEIQDKKVAIGQTLKILGVVYSPIGKTVNP